MTHTIPTSFRITATADGIPSEGLLVLITIRMTRKNPHRLVVGPTDAFGRITVSHSEIEADAASQRAQFPSDYADLTLDFAGTMDVAPMTHSQLQDAIQAHQLWKDIAAFPASHADRLKSALTALKNLNPHRITVTIDDLTPPTTVATLIPGSVADPMSDRRSSIAV